MVILQTAANDQGLESLQGQLLNEANHRIANHLSVIVGMVQVQASALSRGPETISRGDVHALLQQTAGKIISVSHLHRKLASQPHQTDIDVSSYLVESCTALLSTLELHGRVGIVYELHTKRLLSAERAQALSLMVNEIVMNAVKHAHPTDLPVQIHLVSDEDSQGRTVIEIYDDGIGLPEDFDETEKGGVGFKLIRTLARQLDAQLRVESSALGLSFRVTLSV